MTTIEQLTEVFYDNFMAYYRSHVAHVNIVGRNFQSDHALLSGIYEDLQGQIDVLAELLRTLQAEMPNDLMMVMNGASVSTFAMEGSADEMLMEVKGDLLQLKGCYEELMAIAEEEELDHIANYAQDRVLALAKMIWMLNATLD